MATPTDEQPFAQSAAAERYEDVEKTNHENVEKNADSEPAKHQDAAEKTVGDSVELADSNDATPGSTSTSDTPTSTPWQAIFAPQYNTYYFYNAETQQTTWENPLLQNASASTSSSGIYATSDATSLSAEDPATSIYTTPHAALEAAALAAGIDPSLAHLDPSLLSSIPSSSGAPAGLPPAFAAKFNARTGQFARPDARDPTHLSEHARAARMSEFYFDVGAWEKQLAEQGGSIMGGEEEGKKRKRPSKKDLERFKEQKKQKKLAKTAWLRT